ncbi:MAG: hypothetical protein ABIQ11_10415 [Saprospiraceae bacterium]
MVELSHEDEMQIEALDFLLIAYCHLPILHAEVDTIYQEVPEPVEWHKK